MTLLCVSFNVYIIEQHEKWSFFVRIPHPHKRVRDIENPQTESIPAYISNKERANNSCTTHNLHIQLWCLYYHRRALISRSFILARPRCRSSADLVGETSGRRKYVFKNYSNCIYFLRFIQCFSILLLSCAVVFIFVAVAPYTHNKERAPCEAVVVWREKGNVHANEVKAKAGMLNVARWIWGKGCEASCGKKKHNHNRNRSLVAYASTLKFAQ